MSGSGTFFGVTLENFKVEDGHLKYRKYNRVESSGAAGEWKLCVCTEEEKGRILQSCHASALG